MSACRKLALVFGLVTLLLAMRYGSYKVPDGTNVKARFWLIAMRIIEDVISVAAWLDQGEPAMMLRGLVKSMKSTVPEGVTSEDLIFDGIHVRVYTPTDAAQDGAGMVYFHGGGFIMGSVDGYNDLVGDIAKASGMVVVSVEYRLAPEHKFPAAFDDCEKATRYFLKHSADFHVDPKRVAVAGDSSGGNLAAAVALKLGPVLKAQILIYPALQALDFDTPSFQITGPKASMLASLLSPSFWLYYAQGHNKHHDAVLHNNHTSSAMKKTIAKSYVNINSLPDKYIPKEYVRGSLNYGNAEIWKELKEIMLNPYFAPLVAPDVSTKQVSQGMVLTCEYDGLRDDGILYVQKLKMAGVEVSHYHSWDGIHGMLSLPGRQNSLSVEKMFDAIIQYVKQTL